MSTGHRYVFSDGFESKSQLTALLHLKAHPELTVERSELSMAGTTKTDVTETFRRTLTDHGYGSGA